jgi:TetR/AcrR family transcriptional repressor of nem operon
MTSETATALLDAAETRIRAGGYNGFSFRDLAADLGIKSASVHYHFPSKASLATAVARRYGERVLAATSATVGGDPLPVWREAFRSALRADGRMCLCGVLGAETSALPAEVAAEARSFFERALEQLAEALEGRTEDPRGLATRVLATLEGAMLLARALDDPGVFDLATQRLGEAG